MASMQNSLVFDASYLQHRPKIPPEFKWPDHEKPCPEPPPILDLPPIDLGKFPAYSQADMTSSSSLINKVCRKHGFFSIVNHGVDMKLIEEVHEAMGVFFILPLEEKQKIYRKPGDSCGYASSFTNRFSLKLPWKETLSFSYSADSEFPNTVECYIKNSMGEGYGTFGYKIWSN